MACWQPGDLEDAVNDGRDYQRERRIGLVRDDMATAWSRLTQMRTSLSWHDGMERWVCYEPTGEICEKHDLHDMIMHTGDDPAALIEKVYALWMARGMPLPPAPVDVTCDGHPDASEPAPYWPEVSDG